MPSDAPERPRRPAWPPVASDLALLATVRERTIGRPRGRGAGEALARPAGRPAGRPDGGRSRPPSRPRRAFAASVATTALAAFWRPRRPRLRAPPRPGSCLGLGGSWTSRWPTAQAALVRTFAASWQLVGGGLRALLDLVAASEQAISHAGGQGGDRPAGGAEGTEEERGAGAAHGPGRDGRRGGRRGLDGRRRPWRPRPSLTASALAPLAACFGAGLRLSGRSYRGLGGRQRPSR